MRLWRIIPLHTCSAFEAMSIDHAVRESVAEGSNPTIRFWRWKPSAVSIGFFQAIDDEVDVDKCKQLGVDVVRRMTGGGAVYHDFDGEITYSVAAPESLLPKGLRESYAEICSWAIKGLGNLGIDAEFRPINDIVAGGRKISGNAQTRKNGVVLQHGTVLYDLDVKRMFSVLKVSKEKISDKAIKNVEDRVTKVLDFGKFTIDEVYQALLEGFADGKEWEDGRLTDEEISKAKELENSMYRTDGWNFKR